METIKDQIENLNEQITLNQQSFLLDCMVKVFVYLNEEQKSAIWQLTEFMTARKYKYLLALYFSWKEAREADKWLAKEKLRKELNIIIN